MWSSRWRPPRVFSPAPFRLALCRCMLQVGKFSAADSCAEAHSADVQGPCGCGCQDGAHFKSMSCAWLLVESRLGEHSTAWHYRYAAMLPVQYFGEAWCSVHVVRRRKLCCLVLHVCCNPSRPDFRLMAIPNNVFSACPEQGWLVCLLYFLNCSSTDAWQPCSKWQ